MKQYFLIYLFINLSIVAGTQIINGQPFTATGFNYHYVEGDDNVLDKPVIILEGFDIENNNSAQAHYNSWSGFLDSLESNDYDIIALSYNDPYKSMHDNVDYLKDFIKEVNADKTGYHEITIIGQSMGGVIARMALAELEDESYDHQTGLYVSFDAPHKGANIPKGIQTFTEDFVEVDLVESLDWAYELFDEMISFFIGSDLLPNPDDKYLTALHSLSAQQMLIYHTKHNEGDHEFNDMQSYLDGLGYPQKCKNIALINGNNQGDTLPFPPGENFYHRERGNCDFATSYTFDIDISDINNDHDRVSLLRLRHAPFCIDPTNREGHGDFGPLCWDNAPGASYSTDISGAIGGTGVEQFCFLPTVSSIDLNQSIIDNQGLDYYNEEDGVDAQHLVENNETPFDNIYSRFDNTDHVDEGDVGGLIDFIINNELMWDVKYLQNRAISFNRDFEAVTSIIAGEDVRSFTNQYDGETGEFIVESGKTTFSAPEVILEGGFEVKKGAEFEIK
jgi:pimeloyl-ACP methyl ester carboxylesterase